MILKLAHSVSLYSKDPDKNGLSLVDYVDYSDGNYCFDYRAVWVDSENRLWTARDSGCSCPSPFEDTIELERVFNLDELQQEYQDGRSGYPSIEDWQVFKQRLQDILGKASAI